MRWHDVRGHRVVDTTSAEAVGTLDGLVIDPDAHRVVDLVVGDRVLRWSDADGIGADAVTVKDPDLLREPDTDEQRHAVDGTTDPVGKAVYTEDGFELGVVEDIEFDAGTGNVEVLATATERIPGSRLLGLGSYAVVVRSTRRDGDGSSRRTGTPADPTASSASASRTDLEGLSRDELYELAQQRKIRGRSKMKKQELIEALS
jgi:sporulation protein YlmC with PRC-barrel domain